MQTNATNRNKYAEIADFELADLRRAIATLPANDRGGFARLCILMLLIDMQDVDRALTLSMLRTVYYPAVK
jgi:hypothetical protein